MRTRRHRTRTASIPAAVLFVAGNALAAGGQISLAAVEYHLVSTNYGYSEYVDDAYFKEALCFYHQALKPPLDQTKRLEALERLERFVTIFPQSPLIPEAQSYIGQIHAKLAEIRGHIRGDASLTAEAISVFRLVVYLEYGTEYAREKMSEAIVALGGELPPERPEKYKRAQQERQRRRRAAAQRERGPR